MAKGLHPNLIVSTVFLSGNKRQRLGRIVSFTGRKCIQFFKECSVVYIVRTIAGIGHSNLAVDSIDRPIAHVDGLICCSQSIELVKNWAKILLFYQGLKMIDGHISELFDEPRFEDLLFDVNAVAKGIVSKPAGQLAGGIMYLYVKRTLVRQ